MAQDLSHLAAGSLGAESQAATSTVSRNTAMTAPGSRSQQSDGAEPGNPHLDVGGGAYDAPEPVHGAPGGEQAWAWDDVSGRREPWGP